MISLLLSACQSSGWFTGMAASDATRSGENQGETTKSGAKSVSGLYVFQFQNKSVDGKGKVQNEFGRFSYAVDEVSPGSAAVRYEGESTYASKSAYGGTDGAWVRVAGMATLKQGVWVLNTTTGGNCEVRFQNDGQNLRHLSAICQQPGQFGHLAWPPAQTTVKFVRLLQAAEQSELRALRKPR
ncbi:MAG TPA: hypothetical protein PLW86_03110 [Rhodocyclaceae bacterium]|nr:hypothetical protein [Rhodocyclaceae bacterium]